MEKQSNASVIVALLIVGALIALAAYAALQGHSVIQQANPVINVNVGGQIIAATPTPASAPAWSAPDGLRDEPQTTGAQQHSKTRKRP